MPQLTCQFFLWLSASIAITVTSGVYLWQKDENITCSAPNSYNDRGSSSEWIDVSKRFSDVLKLFFACALTDVVRSALALLAVRLQSGALATWYQVLALNDVVGFGALIVLHVFRFQLSGRICSGDYD